MIQNGSKVKVHFTLRVDDKVVASSFGKEPLAFVQGQGQIIPGLEEQLEGLKAGEKTQVTITPEKGYGHRDAEAVRTVPKAAFRNADQLKVGDKVSGDIGGHRFEAQIARVGPEDITLDMNHPLAGKTLHVEVQVVEIL